MRRVRNNVPPGGNYGFEAEFPTISIGRGVL